jgi:hypothetical protein
MMAPRLARAFVRANVQSVLHGLSQPISVRYQLLPRLRSQDPDLELLRRLRVEGTFEPSPGYVFLALKLHDLKLRSLAAVCMHRFGRSTLAEVFARGEDPCEYAAAALMECAGADDFATLKQNKPDVHDTSLMVADALLKAAPLGLSQDRVCEFVSEQPGLEVAPRTTAALCYKRLVDDVYPELSKFLGDDTLAVMARITLTGRVRGCLPFSQARAAEFLDLADDAAKSALFAVLMAGYRVVAYADDTILVELAESAQVAEQAELVKGIAQQGTEEVLHGVPAFCRVELLAQW